MRTSKYTERLRNIALLSRRHKSLFHAALFGISYLAVAVSTNLPRLATIDGPYVYPGAVVVTALFILPMEIMLWFTGRLKRRYKKWQAGLDVPWNL